MNQKKTILIVGASRGLGLALTEEFLNRDWAVIGTARGERTKLHELAEKSGGRFRIEQVDITNESQVAQLRERLGEISLDVLFVNAGIGNKGGMAETIGNVATDDFVNVMITNTLSPMRVIETLQGQVRDGGTIGVMSSGQGSIADNERGGNDVYRGSKAALNMIMRSFAARVGRNLSLLLLAPGWVKTELGGSQATFSIEEVTPKLVDTIIGQEGRPGLQYLDRFGKTVRW